MFKALKCAVSILEFILRLIIAIPLIMLPIPLSILADDNITIEI